MDGFLNTERDKQITRQAKEESKIVNKLEQQINKTITNNIVNTIRKSNLKLKKRTWKVKKFKSL